MEIIEEPLPPYASFGNRLLAYIIDYFIIGVISSILAIPFLMTTGFMAIVMGSGPVGEEEAQSMAFQMMGAFGLYYLLLVVIAWLYFAGQESGSKQATLGKRAMNIKVCTLSGERISFGRASGRFFAKILSRMILWIGYIMAAFTEKKQALHDIIAETLVVERE